ncbi:hypothetical protein [Baaleninema sp.]|uniref:hypothetical protein n=1 Tax=Baaleninema sp. TaxID=3101197 RepID=UPI003D010880
MTATTDRDRRQFAERKIDQFARSKMSGMWPKLDKATLIEQLRSRVRNPLCIDQGKQPLCGPASIAFALAQKDPVRYVQICRNIYQLGGFYGTTKWITASDALQHQGGKLNMPQLDWMFQATLREAENQIFPVWADAPELLRNLSGMTKPWEIAGWTQQVLQYANVTSYPAYLGGDVEALEAAESAVASGGVAFALVNADGLLLEKSPPMSYPSHWIVFLGNLKRDGDRFRFDVYSWARKQSVTCELASLKKHLWDVVVGRP